MQSREGQQTGKPMIKLIDEPPLIVLPTIAKAIGLNESIVLQQLHYRLHMQRYMKKGKSWWPMTIEEWQRDEFPFWSIKTVNRIFDNLEARNLIERTDLWNTKGRDRTNWFTIDYDVFDEVARRAEQKRLTNLAL